MKDVHAAVEFAIQYLHSDMPGSNDIPVEECRLNRRLQYDLCAAYNRIQKLYGEVTRKDISMLCDSYLISNGSGPYPLYHSPKDSIGHALH